MCHQKLECKINNGTTLENNSLSVALTSSTTLLMGQIESGQRAII